MEIRFSDQDSQQHVSHIPIISWMAHARVEYLDSKIDDSKVEDIDYILVHISADFVQEITFPGTIEVEITVNQIGTKSLTLDYDLYKGGSKFAEGKSVSVFISNGNSVKIPDELRKVLNA